MSDDANMYPTHEGWWWIEASDGLLIPVKVEAQKPDEILWACIPRCSTHCDEWWRPLAVIKGRWHGEALTIDQGRDIKKELWKEIQELPVVMPMSPAPPHPMVKLRDLHGLFCPNNESTTTNQGTK